MVVVSGASNGSVNNQLGGGLIWYVYDGVCEGSPLDIFDKNLVIFEVMIFLQTNRLFSAWKGPCFDAQLVVARTLTFLLPLLPLICGWKTCPQFYSADPSSKYSADPAWVTCTPCKDTGLHTKVPWCFPEFFWELIGGHYVIFVWVSSVPWEKRMEMMDPHVVDVNMLVDVKV